jgi:hypothetical protein
VWLCVCLCVCVSTKCRQQEVVCTGVCRGCSCAVLHTAAIDTVAGISMRRQTVVVKLHSRVSQCDSRGSFIAHGGAVHRLAGRRSVRAMQGNV